jgi:hypothetical protein
VPLRPSSPPTMDDSPTTDHRDSRPSSDIALLAATALGFAYGRTESDETLTRRLVTLADLHPESLSGAQAAVLTLGVGSAQARRRAGDLLHNAAQSIADLRGAGLPTEPAATSVTSLVTAIEGRP